MNTGRNGAARSALYRTAVILFLFFIAYLITYFFFGAFIDEAGRRLSASLGYAGVFLYVLLVDTFIVPATADIIFVFTEHWNPFSLVLTMSGASILGGFFGLQIGRGLAHLRWVDRAVDYYREKGTDMIERYGTWGVALAAFTPVPYSTISWIAGMMEIPTHRFLLASLLRVPRFALYYIVFRSGTELVQFLSHGL